MPVDLVTIHHEGAGTATDSNLSRMSEGGYCYATGISVWERFRAPAQGWATYQFNGQDLTVCISGNRMVEPFGASDVALIHECFMDCFNRGEVTASPLVRAHRNSPGSSTVCPGDNTMVHWSEVEAACRAGGTAPKPEPVPPAQESESDEMVIIGLTKDAAPGNQQPFGFLDPAARKVWSRWGFRIAWDGAGDDALHGTTDPYFINVPGTADVTGWALHERIDNNRGACVCVYGAGGAEYWATAHG